MFIAFTGFLGYGSAVGGGADFTMLFTGGGLIASFALFVRRGGSEWWSG